MFAACIYIIKFMAQSAIKNTPYSDISKSVKDFLFYAKINLTWYSFNFVQVVVPLLLIVMMDTAHAGISMADRDGSYETLMYILLGTHVFQFLFNSKIYVKSLKENDDSYIRDISGSGPSFLQKLVAEENN